MANGRTPEERSELAGKRFRLAKEIFGTYSCLFDDPRWRKHVDIWDEKTLRRWMNNGVPTRKIPKISRYFKVEPKYFTDPDIKDEDFKRLIFDPGYEVPSRKKIIFIPSAPQIFVGRGSDLETIKALFNAETNDQMIAIHGLPGVGKTTFATALVNDTAVQNAFPDGIFWIPMGVGFNPISAFSTLGQRHLLDSRKLQQITRLENAISILRDRIAGKRLLLLLDDAWEVEHVAGFRQSAGQNNALVITTRSPEIARHLVYSRNSVYPLDVFKEEDSMELLKILIPEAIEENYEQCIELVNSLENLPLAIHVVGRMLRMEYETWSDVKGLLRELQESIGSVFDQRAPHDLFDPVEGKIPTVEMLFRKSTDRLDEKTRICFAALGAFAPEPATFDLKRIKAAWAGIGVKDPKPVVTELTNRGLLEPLKNGRFQMHALLVAHAENLLENL